MGLTGMVENAIEEARKIDLLDNSRFNSLSKAVSADDHGSVSKLLTLAENADDSEFQAVLQRIRSVDADSGCPVVGLTGTGGAGKSSLTDELMLRIQRDNPCLLYTSPSPRDKRQSRMPSSA